MRLKAPRIAPVDPADWNDEQKALAAPILSHGKMLARGEMFNIFRTQLAHPEAMKGFLGLGQYVLSKRNTLPRRDRELVILRIGFLCKSGYEWAQHHSIGLHCGLTEAEIAAIKQGADAPNWNASDRALIHAADELHHDQFITDGTWAELCKHFSTQQVMDVIYTAGQYTLVSMFLNSVGVQLDEGLTLDPDLAKG